MKRIIVFAILLIVLFGSCSKKTDVTPKASEEQPYYQLDLYFDPVKHTISGKETVKIYNSSEDDWNQICLRDYPSDDLYQKFPNGGITDITNIIITYSSGEELADNNVLSRDKQDKSIIYFDLRQALKPKDIVTICFDFCVYIPELEDRFGYSNSRYNLEYFFPVKSVYRDGNWVNHPCNEKSECAYTECATFDVKVASPEEYTIITTGEPIETKEGITTIHAENVRDFTMVIGNNYEVSSTEYEGIQINIYYSKEYEAASKIAIQTAVDALELFGTTIGPYPYQSFDIVEVPFGEATTGIEYPQLIKLSEYCF